MQVIAHTAPAYWASCLINHDSSGLTEAEKAEADAWLASLGLGEPVSADGEYVAKWQGLLTNVTDYVFLVKE